MSIRKDLAMEYAFIRFYLLLITIHTHIAPLFDTMKASRSVIRFDTSVKSGRMFFIPSEKLSSVLRKNKVYFFVLHQSKLTPNSK